MEAQKQVHARMMEAQKAEQTRNQRGSLDADKPPLSREFTCNSPEGSHFVLANWLQSIDPLRG